MKSAIHVAASLLMLAACGDAQPKAGTPTNNGVNNGVNNGQNNGGQNNGANNGATNNGIMPGPTVIDPADYARNCEWDSDCFPIVSGDVCGCGTCPTHAISRTDVPIYEGDLAGAGAACPPDTRGCDIQCEQTVAVCPAATSECTVIPQIIRTTAGFSKDCEVDADCAIVPTGPVCSDCDCGRDAIAASEVEAFNAEIDGAIDCRPGPSACDCEPPNAAVCNAGTCEATFQ